MKMPPTASNFWALSKQGDDTHELLIYGAIGESWWDETVTAKALVRELAGITASKITVRINSPGGSVSDGLAIYNALRSHPAEITTINEGQAASIASLILMAGDTVKSYSNALVMVHAPWSYVEGNSAALREFADVLDTHARAMATSYARKTGRDVGEMQALLTDGVDHWYTASEATEMGFVDSVIESENTTDVPAKADAKAAWAGLFHDSPTGAIAALRRLHPRAATGGDSPEPIQMSKPTVAPAVDATNTEEVRAGIVAAERSRRDSIRSLFVAARTTNPSLDTLSKLEDECIGDENVNAEVAGTRILAALAAGAAPTAAPRVEAGPTSDEKRIDAMTQALLARVNASTADGKNPYRGLTLAEMARESLQARGIKTQGMERIDIASAALGGVVRGAMTTSDFPVVLENTMHKLLLNGFGLAQVTWSRWCKTGDVSDFREWKRLVPGLIGNLDDVNEHGEYRDKMIPDATSNSISVKRRGNVVSVTPELLVNDDLGYLTTLSTALGRAASTTIERRVYALLESNPVLADGQPLFSAAHNNLAATGSAPTVTSVDAAATAMALQTAPGPDAEYLDITPSVYLAHTSRRGDAIVLFQSEYDPDATNKLQRPNKVRGIVGDIVVSPRLSVLPWYLFADANNAPVIEVVFLNGQRAPRLVAEESFRTSGYSWKVEMPFGVGAIDYRGAYRNPGA